MLYFLYVVMVLSVFEFLVLTSLFSIGLYLVVRPHWTKIFFSYSHKDARIAEQIVERLNGYKFRVYVDFGLEIQAEDLERELNNAIKKRNIFMLTASANSADSYWVQFEINRAKQNDEGHFSQWRDMVIVALDDRGVNIAEELKSFNERRIREFWNLGRVDASLAQKSPPERAKSEANIKHARWFLGLWPFMRRILTPEIQTFDLTSEFEGPMREVEEYLKNNTRFAAFWPGRKYALLQKSIILCLMLALFFWTVVFGVLSWFLVSRLLF